MTYFSLSDTIFSMALFDVFKKKQEKERFDRKRKEKTAETKIETKPEALTKASSFITKKGKKGESPAIIPHITEKATFLQKNNAYVFKVKNKTNKVIIARDVKKIYGVVPTKVSIINVPSKQVFVRGKHGAKAGYKKAIVYLKKGEKINLA